MFIVNNKISLAIALLLLAIVAMVLAIIEKKIAARKLVPIPITVITPEVQIQRLLEQRQPTSSTLDEIDSIARMFFEQQYNIPQNSDYNDIIKQCIAKNKMKAVQFTRKMMRYIYAGEELDSYKMAVLLTTLRKIIEEERKETPVQMTKIQKILSYFQRRKNTVQQKEEEKELEKEDALVFESLRNLKPVVIKPELFRADSFLRNKKQKFGQSIDIDNFSRIKGQLNKNKNALI